MYYVLYYIGMYLLFSVGAGLGTGPGVIPMDSYSSGGGGGYQQGMGGRMGRQNQGYNPGGGQYGGRGGQNRNGNGPQQMQQQQHNRQQQQQQQQQQRDLGELHSKLHMLETCRLGFFISHLL